MSAAQTNAQSNNSALVPTLLRLPPELRLVVYDGLFPRNRPPTQINMFQTDHDCDRSLSPSNLPVVQTAMALFGTSRQIHREVAHIFYSRHHFTIPRSVSASSRFGSTPPGTFHVRFFPIIKQFFRTIGPFNASSIRHLTIPFPAADCKLLKNSPGRSKRWWPRHTSGEMLEFLIRTCPDLETVHWEYHSTWNFIIYTLNDFYHSSLQSNSYFVRVMAEIDRVYRQNLTRLRSIVWDHSDLLDVPGPPMSLWRTLPNSTAPCNCCTSNGNFEIVAGQLGWEGRPITLMVFRQRTVYDRRELETELTRQTRVIHTLAVSTGAFLAFLRYFKIGR